MIVTQRMAPPMVPSQVFFVDIFENGVLPTNEPTKYAMVSFIQIEKIIPHGMIFKKLSGTSFKECKRISIIKMIGNVM